jgi:hypothetical protein
LGGSHSAESSRDNYFVWVSFFFIVLGCNWHNKLTQLRTRNTPDPSSFSYHRPTLVLIGVICYCYCYCYFQCSVSCVYSFPSSKPVSVLDQFMFLNDADIPGA